MSNAQLLISASIPSILILLSWLHNNSRLNRLETGQDNLSRRIDDLSHRMDDVVKNFHSDMMSFQASMLEAVYTLRERVAVIESKQP